MTQLFHPRAFLLVFIFAASGAFEAVAETSFLGISAGDMTADSVVLWSRMLTPTSAMATAEIARDRAFHNIVVSEQGTVKPENNSTIKLKVSGLQPNTRYFYRFVSGKKRSWNGSFYTNPSASDASRFKIAFSGDADQKYRPYPVMEYFGASANRGSQNLNAFIYLGDTIYETTAGELPGFGKPSSDPLNTAIPTGKSSPEEANRALSILNLRYDANIQGVDPKGNPRNRPSTGLNGVRSMMSATGLYTVLDNHEIFGPLQSGGAPIQALKENSDSAFAVNPKGPYNNDSIAFLAETKAFYNNMPTAVDINGRIDFSKSPAERYGLSYNNVLTPESAVVSSTDPRTSGKPANYFSRRWGKNIYYIQLDDRSYRDARMVAPARYALTPPALLQEARFDAKGNLDPAQAYDQGFQKGDPLPGVYMTANQTPGRTLLGSTQLDWFLKELAKVKQSGALWTVIAVSTPIDQRGSLTDSKSWVGGYPTERNVILKYIADLKLQNIIFLTTDDHNARVNKLQYQPDPGDDSRWEQLPYAFQILAGPMGAIGPDQPPYADTKRLGRDFQNVLSRLSKTNDDLTAFQQPLIGLSDYPGLSNVSRSFDKAASSAPNSVDFFTPDTFGYTTLEWDEIGVLTVKYWGIKAYGANQYPIARPKPDEILSFSIAPHR